MGLVVDGSLTPSSGTNHVSRLEAKRNRDTGWCPMSSEEITFQPVKKAQASPWKKSAPGLIRPVNVHSGRKERFPGIPPNRIQ
ncbi:Paired Amphipathic Helix Protein Sin3B [Manis pentadactyla]|nr:Paired Amphipathic Helix Protein Sin3B [Manis pentadactyla]